MGSVALLSRIYWTPFFLNHLSRKSRKASFSFCIGVVRIPLLATDSMNGVLASQSIIIRSEKPSLWKPFAASFSLKLVKWTECKNGIPHCMAIAQVHSVTGVFSSRKCHWTRALQRPPDPLPKVDNAAHVTESITGYLNVKRV